MLTQIGHTVYKGRYGVSFAPSGGVKIRTVTWDPTLLNRLYCINFVIYRKFAIHCYSENNT